MDWVANVAAEVCKYRPQYRVAGVPLLVVTTVLVYKIAAIAFVMP